MTYYEHATHLALRLGPWARPDAPDRAQAGHEIEAALARAQKTPPDPAHSDPRVGPIAALLSMFGRY